MPKVTINDIAREAGVSKTAVSFAFNDPSQLAPSTVKNILDVAERLGYTPDPIARSMTTKRTNALGLLLPHDIAAALANPYYTQFIRGVGHVSGKVGRTLMLVPPLWGSTLKAIPHATVDGFIVVGLELDRDEIRLLRRRHVPFVIVDSQAPEDIPSVNVDDRSGAQAVLEHVLAQGHRQIAIIGIESGKATPAEYTGTVGERFQGYCDALAAYNLSLGDPQITFLETPSSWQGGKDAFARLWASSSRPTAVVAMSDIIAIGVHDAASEHGVAMPTELSLVGFDDLPDAVRLSPTLTTVRQPVEQKGALATELLVAALEEPGQAQHHMLSTELVIRDSVVPPRATPAAD